MTKHKTLWGLAALLAVILISGCKNNNLFGGLHDDGSGDAESLVADANAALASKDYDKANSYFEKALAQDPKNSDALYGQAAAAMGMSGLNIGQLVANLTTDGAGGSSLSANITQSTERRVITPAVDSRSLLYGIDYAKLDEALGTVIVNLETIRMGYGDGKVAPDNPSLLINLGVSRVLKAATSPLANNLLDIRDMGGSFEVVELVDRSTFDGDQCDVVENSVKNVVWGYLNLRDAAIKLNLVSGSTLNDIKSDVDELFDRYLAYVESYCVEVVDSVDDAGVPSNRTDGL
jgi:tetratricopeptide (TPR) repeat protein